MNEYLFLLQRLTETPVQVWAHMGWRGFKKQHIALDVLVVEKEVI